MTVRLLVATSNAGKLREFREMLAGEGLDVLDLGGAGVSLEVEETGAMFAENARLKATGYARAAGLWTLADDSGLEVDALGGAPGVHSARWAERHGAGSGTQANNALLLQQMDGVDDARRGARFVCALALADPGGEVRLESRGEVCGSILRVARGPGGFGYDPLFLVGGLERTAAELAPAEKHAVSHRGSALRQMRERMRTSGLPSPR